VVGALDSSVADTGSTGHGQQGVDVEPQRRNLAMTVPGAGNPVPVELSSVSGSATLVYQVDTTHGIVTVTPQDLTSSTGLANVSAALLAGTPVKAFGVPQADESIQSVCAVLSDRDDVGAVSAH
jgi:hypothetical protein